jgi:dCMP deaminase
MKSKIRRMFEEIETPENSEQVQNYLRRWAPKTLGGPPKLENFYMKMAISVSKLSYCTRRKVGAVIVNPNQALFIGYNGMPSGMENVCELENGSTDPRVIHAEENAILKVARSNERSVGSVMYTSTAPCITCSRLILNSGIKYVYYNSLYRSVDGLILLEENGINCTFIDVID